MRPLFPDRLLSTAYQFLNFAGFLFRFSRDLQIRVIRRLSDLLLNVPFHFVDFALGLVFGAWFHHFFLRFVVTIKMRSTPVPIGAVRHTLYRHSLTDKQMTRSELERFRLRRVQVRRR